MIEFDAKAAQAKLALIVERVRAANEKIAVDAAHLIQARAASKLHVGYGVQSGTMRRSGHVDGPRRETLDRASAKVGPSVIYARRFELGFTGPDRLGRTFPYRPRPYWKPAYEESLPAVNALAARRWEQAIKEAG